MGEKGKVFLAVVSWRREGRTSFGGVLVGARKGAISAVVWGNTHSGRKEACRTTSGVFKPEIMWAIGVVRSAANFQYPWGGLLVVELPLRSDAKTNIWP